MMKSRGSTLYSAMLKESWIIQLASAVIVFHSFSSARTGMLCIGYCKLQYDMYASYIMDAGRLISVLGFADKIDIYVKRKSF